MNKFKTKKKRIRRIKPYGRTYEQRVNELARDILNINPCKDCGSPVAEPYCCGYCGSVEPN